MNLDLSTSVSYLQVIGATATQASANYGPANLSQYKGKVAIIVTTGTSNGTTPSFTGYFKSSADTNISNATNVNVTTYNQAANALAVNPLSVVSTGFVTNGTNQVIVLGLDTRLSNQYLWIIGTVAGTNTPNIPLSVVIAGLKQVEPQ